MNIPHQHSTDIFVNVRRLLSPTVPKLYLTVDFVKAVTNMNAVFDRDRSRLLASLRIKNISFLRKKK